MWACLRAHSWIDIDIFGKDERKMNKTISKVTALLAALVVAVCAMPAAVSADSTTLKGLGTQTDPYVITTAGQLKELNTKDEVWYVQLGADIDMNGVVLDNKTYVIKKLTGEFDGKGHTISNLTLAGGTGTSTWQGTTYVNTGLIGELAGTVKNIRVEIKDITDINKVNTVGVLAGQISEGSMATIDNCIVSGSIAYKTGKDYTFVGGIVGMITGSKDKCTTITVDNCISNVAISGASSTYYGGIIGSAQYYSNVNISNSSILGNISGSGNAGGVVGYINSGSVSLELSNTLLCAKVGASKNFGISYNTSSITNKKITAFYYDSTLNPSPSSWSSFAMLKNGNYGLNGYTAKTTTEMKSLNLEGFKVVEGKYDGYPVPVWKTSGGDEPITYSITLDDSKIKAVVSAAKTGTYCVVFASYNGDTLTSVGMVKRKFDAGANQSVDAPKDFNATGAKTVKAMLLRSLEDIYPLCEAAQK